MSRPQEPSLARQSDAPIGFVRRTTFDADSGTYGEELIPLDQAYADVVKRLDVIDSEREALGRRYAVEDIRLQRKWWRESVERSDSFQQDVTERFQETLDSARSTYKVLTAMSITLFIVGIALFVFAGVYATFANEKIYSLVFGGLGASSFVALFIARPFEDAQIALSDMIQGEMAFMSYFEQIRMWASFPWANGELVETRAEKASTMLHRRTAEAMKDLQRFVEPLGKSAPDLAIKNGKGGN